MFLTLMYHIVDDTIDAAIAVREGSFKSQIEYLASQQYKSLSIKNAIDILNGDLVPDEKSILITFDDGYADNLYKALPVLVEYNMRATVFINTAYIGKNNRWNTKACYDSRHMDWNELLGWVNQGFDVGGHSHDHLCMVRLSEKEINKTISVNKNILEDRLNIDIQSFSYPYGMYNYNSMSIVSKYYSLAFSVKQGGWNPKMNRFSINRIGVDPDWDIVGFSKKLDEHTSLVSI